MKEVAVLAGYHCPLCPDHTDDRFYSSALFNRPICEGCSLELHSFAEEEERPDDFLIDAVERVTGRAWEQCRLVLLQETRQYWEQLRDKELEEWIGQTSKACGLSRDECLRFVEERIRDLQRLLGTR
jgi:hypothetical protein